MLTDRKKFLKTRTVQCPSLWNALQIARILETRRQTGTAVWLEGLARISTKGRSAAKINEKV
jgi:hypothetical protein